jgi:hypothetical protein
LAGAVVNLAAGRQLVIADLDYLSIYGFTALVDLGRFFSFLTNMQSAELLGWGISQLQDRYLHTEQHK